MIVNPTTITKITKAFELICPMFKENLIEQAFIVGSVAKGTAKKESDIDIYLINSKFKEQKYTHDIQLISNIDEIDINKDVDENIHITKILDALRNLSVEFKYLSSKHDMLWFGIYKNEIFHFMYDYESESIMKGGDYIEITNELCDEVN